MEFPSIAFTSPVQDLFSQNYQFFLSRKRASQYYYNYTQYYYSKV